MEFHFQLPIRFAGRQAAEIDMTAELSGSPDDYIIDELYAYELAPGCPRYEIEYGSREWIEAELYLARNPQEQQRIENEWPEDDLPRRPFVSEHSTLWSAL